jgi:hypothetical protein
MRARTFSWTAVGLGLALATAAVAAPEEPAPGKPAPQKKVDHPFVKAIAGSWTWTSTATVRGEAKGTIEWRLGLLDTAVLEDVRGASSMGAFEGHGVWRVSEDGTTVRLWWFDNMTPVPESFTGTLGPDGYDVKSASGRTMSLKTTATGLEMRSSRGPQESTTVVFTRK